MADVAAQQQQQPDDAPAPPPKKRMVKRKPARKQVRSPGSLPALPRPRPARTDATRARTQVEEGQIEPRVVEQTGQTYNLWYHKWVRPAPPPSLPPSLERSSH